jgi:hypothetical protein
MMKKLIAVSFLITTIVSCTKNIDAPVATAANQTTVTPVTGKNTPGACSNIVTFSLKQGKREAIPTIWSIIMDYSIKPCDNNAPVGVRIDVYDRATSESVFSATGLSFSGKQTFLGVAFGIYDAKLTVYNTETNAVIETRVVSIKVAWPGV